MFTITFTATGATRISVEKRNQARALQTALTGAGIAITSVEEFKAVDLTPKPLTDAQRAANEKRKKTAAVNAAKKKK